MPRRSLAQRHLARLHELLTSASISAVVVGRGMTDLPALRAAADSDRTLAEEVVALARERAWELPEPRPYAWGRMDVTHEDPLPRVARILERDLFELDGLYRGTDDEEVRSLVSQVRALRGAALRELLQGAPAITLPGGK